MRIGKLIEARSGDRIQFRVGSLSPVLCRLEAESGSSADGWKPGKRRRRCFRLIAQGRVPLKQQRSMWKDFADYVNQILRGAKA